MPQRILSLDISSSDLRATVLQTGFRDYRVEGFFHERLSPGGQEEQLARFVAAHSKQGDTILSALPGDRVSWRTLFLPFRDSKKLAQTVPFELESNVAFGLDDVVVDYLVLQRDRAGTTVIAALAPKPELEEHLELLKQAGADPKIVDVGPLAALNTLALVPDLPATFVFLDLGARVTTVALYRDAGLVGLRTLADVRGGAADEGNGSGGPADAAAASPAAALIDELRWALLALNGAPLDDQLPCYVAGDPAVIDAVQDELQSALDLQLRRMTELPLRNLDSAAVAEAPAFGSSLGLALREVSPNSLGVNFRRGEFTFHRSQQELKRRLRSVTALAVVVVALTLGDMYMEYREAAVRLASVEVQIQEVLDATLPEAGRVAQPLAVLQEQIDRVRGDVEMLNDVVPVSNSTSLDILRAVSAAVPNKIRIDSGEYVMDPDAVRLTANTETFESVDAIKQRLLDTGFFVDVQVKDAKAAKGGEGVDFRMTMVLNKDFRPPRRRR